MPPPATQVNLSPYQWQAFYDKLAEQNRISPLDHRTQPVTLSLPDGTYELAADSADAIFRGITDFERQDGKADGIFDRQWVFDYYLRHLQGTNLPLWQFEAVNYRPAPDFVRLQEALKDESIFIELNHQIFPSAATPVRFSLATSVAYYQGWTPEKLSAAKAAFKSAGSEPFVFTVNLDDSTEDAKIQYLTEGMGLGISQPHYYTINLNYPCGAMTDFTILAEHERIHGAFWEYLSRKYPSLLVNAGADKRYPKNMRDYLSRFLHEKFGGVLSPDLKAGIGAALDNPNDLSWLEESIVIGYHLQLRYQKLQETYSGTTSRIIELLRAALAEPQSADLNQTLSLATHQAALAYAIRRPDYAKEIRSLIQEKFQKSPSTGGELLKTFDQMVSLHALVMTTLSGSPGFSKPF